MTNSFPDSSNSDTVPVVGGKRWSFTPAFGSPLLFRHGNSYSASRLREQVGNTGHPAENDAVGSAAEYPETAGESGPFKKRYLNRPK